MKIQLKKIYIPCSKNYLFFIESAITSNPVITNAKEHIQDRTKSTTTSRIKALQDIIDGESLEVESDYEIKQDLYVDSERDITQMQHPKKQIEHSQEDGFTERFTQSLIQSTIRLPVKTTGYKRYWRNFEDKYV